MGRPVILGNGSLTVGLNEQGLVHDFYFPFVGLENLTTARSLHHKIGVWVDGVFSWVDDGSWSTIVNFEDEALVSDVSMRSDKLSLELHFEDCVVSDENTFVRAVTVKNHTDHAREVRVFMHQVFEISRSGRADTALYEPEDKYILDYKGRVTLLIGGRTQFGESFDQFAVGSHGVEGKLGTYVDAEDGELSGSAVEHGGVDSVIRFRLNVPAFEEKTFDYWVIASDSQQSAAKLHFTYAKDGINGFIDKTRKHWNGWLERSSLKRKNINPVLSAAVTKSLLIIKAHTDKHGGIIASCDSSIYNYGRDYYSYVWPRDGAFVLWPLIRLGYKIEAKRFFEFCADIMHHDGYMMHKYQPDKAIGSTWHPLLHGRRKELAIQEDETAVVIFMLGEYLDYSGDEDFVEKIYDSFVRPCANFMSNFIDHQTGLPHASYDLWEEKFMTHTYTAAVTYKALCVAADMAEKFGFDADYTKWHNAAETLFSNQDIFYNQERSSYRKGFLLNTDTGDLQYDNTLDVSSWYGAFMFDYYKDKRHINDGAKTIENELLKSAPIGGSPRYENDNYFASDPKYKGNPWFVTTLWLAQYYIRIGKTEDASGLIQWALQHAGASGALSEQVNPETGIHTGVSPLVWSHAELVNTILDISE